MKINTIDVNAKEWFDKVNGNSYFSGIITLDYGMDTAREYTLDFQYGYGDHYIDMAKNRLVEALEIPKEDKNTLWRYCKENDIILRTSKQENCRKKDL